MILWTCILLWTIVVVKSNSSVYSLVADGNFEKYKDWIIQPVSAWCDQWCGGPAQWTRTPGYYILLAPKAKVTVAQNFNYSILGIESYDICELSFHVRAVNTIDIVFNVVWAQEAISINWATYLATLQNSPTDWVEMHLVLSRMSDSLQFQMTTGYASYLALDNVSLFCSQDSSFFAFSSWEIIFIVVTALIVYGVAHQLYIRAGYGCACCRLCKPRAVFISLQDEPQERTIELTAMDTKRKSVLEDSESDGDEEAGEIKKQRSPFIDE